MYPLKQCVITWVIGLLQTHRKLLRVSLSYQPASSCPYNIRGESGGQVPAKGLRKLSKWIISVTLRQKLQPRLESLNIPTYLLSTVSACHWAGTILSIFCVVMNSIPT